MVWLNGKFLTKPWTQVVSGATPSPPDLHVDEVSGDESTEPEGTKSHGDLGSGIDRLRDVVNGYRGLGCYTFSHKGSR